MAGEIKHKWHGTVLTITSDAGTSSADLKGQRGEEGIRGPQGRCGVIVNADGSIDYGGYATEEYVDYRIEQLEQEEPDLSNYYTKDEIDATLSEFQPSGGGGGGGSTNNAELKITNTAGWLSKTLPQGADCYVEASWSSLEDGLETGGGALTIYVGGIVKYTANVEQGPIRVNVAPYLSTGKSSVRVSIMDVYGNTKSIVYTINVVALIINSTFDATVAYNGDITFTYIPYGSVEKTVHFILDNDELGTEIVSISGRQRTYIIPAQSHGSHKFEVYFESVVDGQTIPSNKLVYDLICVEDGNETPIIASSFDKTSMTQFETINIYYTVYNPISLTSNITLANNSVAVANLTVDRTEQLWSFYAETAGDVELTITCGQVVKTFNLTVQESSIHAEAETENLELYLTSYGRSNSEDQPGSWMYGDVACEFTNYNWKSDGWVTDDDNLIVHRVSGDARLYIPFNVFAVDSKDTGKTFEIEFSTRDVVDYDAVVASCMSGGIGFEMTAQKATLKSEQSEIYTQYKENTPIRLTFVIEKRSENRLMYKYLNGVLCGAMRYPDEDRFSQTEPVGITFGSNDATIDIHTIRIYNNNLTRYQVLDNWIADTRDIKKKKERDERNNIYDDYGTIIINNLPANLPVLTLEAPGLPEYKGNAVKVDATYVDSLNASKCFSFKNATSDVQGTSSAGYPRKNFIIEFPNPYQLRDDSIPTNTFTFKTDYASSEGANNVELARLYNEISPYKTPPQLEDARVRQGIDGFPIVIFHNDGVDTKFIGKFNFNNDKKTPEIFGFAGADQSWEIRNNTSDRVIWKNDDFSGTDWLNDFEARYPKDYKNPSKLSNFSSWVKSTDRTGVSEEEAAARLQKFRDELEHYAVLDSALFYYLFTELFLMVDSRAKNAFPTWFEGEDKVVWLPYDMDTAMGINNEGALTFGYELEDIDVTETGADVYNGQHSVFWNNIRDAFKDELKAMYQKLRSDKVLTYEKVIEAFEAHQSVWPEAIWNEDAWYKYILPLIENGEGSYLGMLLGDKRAQRMWWLYNRFRYMDSKYEAGDAQKDFITIRGYKKSNVEAEPYADIYAVVQYGSYIVQKRALRGNTYVLECPLDTLNDTEIYIYSASQLRSVGDLSGFHLGYADFSKATKLHTLQIGSGAADYSNLNLKELYLGNNTLLQTLDVRNCPNLAQSVDLSGCTNIEYVYFDGTAVKGVTLPNGGILKVLHLPGTITNLRILNQPSLTELVVEGYDNLTNLRLENIGNKIDIYDIVKKLKAKSHVRLIGIDWTFASAADVEDFYDLLDMMYGLDENDRTMNLAQVSGRIHLPMVTGEQLESLQSRYRDIEITYDSLAHVVTYVNYDGSFLYETLIADGTKAIDPVALGYISAPTRPSTSNGSYTFNGWNYIDVITGNKTITATYREILRYYKIRFYNGTELLESLSLTYNTVATYTGDRPVGEDGKVFAGWYPRPGVVTQDMDCYAIFADAATSSTEINDTWEQITTSIRDGSYASKYKRGQWKSFTLNDGNNTTIKMYLVGFAADRDSTGNYLPTTWISDSYITSAWHNSASDSGARGWETCDLRAYLNGSVKSQIPSEIYNSIAGTRKGHYAFTTAEGTDYYYQFTTDDLWVPTHSEYILGSVMSENFPTQYLYAGIPKWSTSGDKYWWLREKFCRSTDNEGIHSSCVYYGNGTIVRLPVRYTDYRAAICFCLA